MEVTQRRTIQLLATSTASLDASQSRTCSTLGRLEGSQARMEVQLQEILAFQQKQGGSTTSQSLDASSPEGRQTWMNLGRLLREDGITPAMIEENRELLIHAIKTSLERKSWSAESSESSYRTAREYSVGEYSGSSTRSSKVTYATNTLDPGLRSINLLSSAPQREATFPDALLERYGDLASSLDERENLETGMKSLLQGMDAEYSSGETAKDNNMDSVGTSQGVRHKPKDRRRVQ